MSNAIKYVGGLALPIHERHLDGWISDRMRAHPDEIIDGKATYQYHKQLAAMKWVKRRGAAVDVGAHCGLWSMNLAKNFARVYAFEPVPLHRECFAINCAGKNVEMYPCALGREDSVVSIHTTIGSSGDSWVDTRAGSEAGTFDVPLRRMDDVLSALPYVDFIKLDCEGYELLALQGGEELIKRSRPCIIVEQKPGRAQKYGLAEIGAVTYLESLGAKLRKEMSGDYIMSWDRTVEEDTPPPQERKFEEIMPGGCAPSIFVNRDEE